MGNALFLIAALVAVALVVVEPGNVAAMVAVVVSGTAVGSVPGDANRRRRYASSDRTAEFLLWYSSGSRGFYSRQHGIDYCRFAGGNLGA